MFYAHSKKTRYNFASFLNFMREIVSSMFHVCARNGKKKNYEIIHSPIITHSSHANTDFYLLLKFHEEDSVTLTRVNREKAIDYRAQIYTISNRILISDAYSLSYTRTLNPLPMENALMIFGSL